MPEDNTTTSPNRPDPTMTLGKRYPIPSLALLVMVLAVLMPAAQYSIQLRDPTPSQLLVAICIAVFSSVLVLWIFDAVNVLRFRSPAVSKSIYGVAIVSILGTGVGVFQDALADRKWPYEGEWVLRVLSTSDEAFIVDHRVVLIHSESADVYWGYSTASFPESHQSNRAVSAEVVEFVPKDGKLSIAMLMPDNTQIAVQQDVKTKDQDKRVVSNEPKGKYRITLVRPR